MHTTTRRPSRFRRAGSAMIAALVGMTTWLVASAPAQAAPGDPFDPADPAVFVAQNVPTRLFKALTNENGAYAFQPEGPVAAIQYNAIGYNPADDYIYGLSSTAGGGIPAHSLIRIGQGGVITRVGTQTYAPGSVIAGFGGDGYYHTLIGNELWRIDVTTGNVVSRIALSVPWAQTGAGADLTFKDGFFWSLGPNSITRINPGNGAAHTWPLPGAGNLAAGASWTYGNGNLGFSQNANGNVVQVAVQNPGAATPVFDVVSISPGPSTNNNDGTASPGRPTDFSIEKTGPATFLPGDTVTYTLTVTNNGPGNSSGWTVVDQLPAGLTGVQADRASCALDGTTLTCTGGRLVAGDSRTVTVTATAPAGTACLTNTAAVIPNEEDPDPSDNEAEVTGCPAALTVEKTAEVTGGTNDGDAVITYTVTATNTTEVDYTEASPAVVHDDLSQVLDDADLVSGPTADRAPAPLYSEPLISWSGPLPAGESVTLTYAVLVKDLGEAGDGDVRNVAWVPADPDDPAPPACEGAENGVDPVTGEPCDTHTIDVEDIPVADPALAALAGVLGLGLAGGIVLHRRRGATAVS